MVWDPPKQQVNVNRMIIYSFIPILSIYAGWRIQKFWVLLGLGYAVGLAVSLPTQMILPFPYGMIFSWIIMIALSVIIIRHFARKYNEKINPENS